MLYQLPMMNRDLPILYKMKTMKLIVSDLMRKWYSQMSTPLKGLEKVGTKHKKALLILKSFPNLRYKEA